MRSIVRPVIRVTASPSPSDARVVTYSPFLKTVIRSVFDEHKGRYGYRRVTAAIRRRGEAVNHKTVQRLMVEMELKSLVRPKKYRSYKGQAGRVAPDLLQRQFSARRMNQKWTTDVTEFNVAGEKLFL